MVFAPHEFIEIANSLAALDSSEASLRTAVGRAYYAAFLIARQNLGVTGRRNVHSRVISELKRTDRFAGDQLDKLEELRGFADYDMDVQDPLFSNWQDNWNKARLFATYIIARIS